MVTKEPNWAQIEKDLTAKYPKFATSSTLLGQIMYFRGVQNFPRFSAAVSNLLQKDAQKLKPEVLNGYAWEIFERCNDQKCIVEALTWSKKSIENKSEPMFIDTYANLLHKSGDTKDAIVWQKKAIAILKEQGEDSKEYEETLGKMEKGEKTWN